MAGGYFRQTSISHIVTCTKNIGSCARDVNSYLTVVYPGQRFNNLTSVPFILAAMKHKDLVMRKISTLKDFGATASMKVLNLPLFVEATKN